MKSLNLVFPRQVVRGSMERNVDLKGPHICRATGQMVLTSVCPLTPLAMFVLGLP